jgi:thiol-disulfide isomerase/thioredoxin
VNKKIVAVTVGLVVLVGGSLVAYGVTRGGDATGSDATSSTTESAATEPSAIEPTATEPAAAPGTEGAYVDYSPTAIAEATGDTVLFFHAPWCPQCRSVESDILSSGVPAGVTIIKVDYDSNQDLRQEYGVTLQTTFVAVDRDGEKLESFVAYDDPRLSAVISALL